MDREAKEFWRQRRREMLRRDRRTRRPGGNNYPITLGLVALMAVGWLVQQYAPMVLVPLSAYGGRLVFLLLSVILPGSLLGLVFSGLFIWVIGSQIESVFSAWQYLLIFFGSGLVGAFMVQMLSGGGGSFAAFGLAGAYVHSMARFDQSGALQWAAVLLLINVVLSGFQPAILIGMLGAFGSGFFLARVTEFKRR